MVTHADTGKRPMIGQKVRTIIQKARSLWYVSVLVLLRLLPVLLAACAGREAVGNYCGSGGTAGGCCWQPGGQCFTAQTR